MTQAMKSHLKSAQQYFSCKMAQEMKIPDDPCTRVICCDCGKEVIAARCRWTSNFENGTFTGPHCGCAGESKS